MRLERVLGAAKCSGGGYQNVGLRTSSEHGFAGHAISRRMAGDKRVRTSRRREKAIVIKVVLEPGGSRSSAAARMGGQSTDPVGGSLTGG